MTSAENFTLLEAFAWNFYIIDRQKTTFQYAEDVPNYSVQMIKMVVALIVWERLVLILQGKDPLRLSYSFSSAASMVFFELFKIVGRGYEFIGYSWLYQYRLIDLQWDSAWTWWAAAISMDFGYYWLHRACHEVNILWATHQLHHSSENYDLTTGLRLTPLTKIFCFGFYHFAALLGVPPAAALVHLQFVLFYQFWIHTELIPSLGPLEYIFNTASHHKIHHGINKWCLDKNYAGWLIIWDRMFGTFQAKRDDEEIVYGIIDQPQTFEPLYLHLYYVRNVVMKALSMETWQLTLKCLFYGPGWHPGTGRLGDPKEIPDKTVPRKKHQSPASIWVQFYAMLHFFIVVLVHQTFMITFSTLNWLSVVVFLMLFFSSLFILGTFFDGHLWVAKFEVLRCAVSAIITYFTQPFQRPFSSVIVFYFIFSTLFWAYQSLRISKKFINKTKYVSNGVQALVKTLHLC